MNKINGAGGAIDFFKYVNGSPVVKGNEIEQIRMPGVARRASESQIFSGSGSRKLSITPFSQENYESKNTPVALRRDACISQVSGREPFIYLAGLLLTIGTGDIEDVEKYIGDGVRFKSFCDVIYENGAQGNIPKAPVIILAVRFCKTNRNEIVDLLQKNGASLAVSDHAGKSLFSHVLDTGDVNLLRQLIIRAGKIDDLYNISDINLDRTVQALMSAERYDMAELIINSQISDEAGNLHPAYPPLFVAAENDWQQFFTWMLNKNPKNVNVKDVSGNNALHCFAKNMRKIYLDPAVRLLNCSEIDVHALDGEGKTAMELFSESGFKSSEFGTALQGKINPQDSLQKIRIDFLQ
ncbi:hypothetical protein [Paraburkholderia bonniea]|uniref:hypothetical protein n=1 Tax=Paraburkholderia bonniea TaxID=2152891 RepID=UPI0012920239|nr:hypothetical protein [Paraburkholderia bonniea]